MKTSDLDKPKKDKLRVEGRPLVKKTAQDRSGSLEEQILGMQEVIGNRAVGTMVNSTSVNDAQSETMQNSPQPLGKNNDNSSELTGPTTSNTFSIVRSSKFHETLDQVKLNSTLLANITALSQHLIQNDLVKGNIVFKQGVRSPVIAHKWSTAWSIRNQLVSIADLQALPEGRDLDGNLWYQPGWTLDDAIRNAISIWNGAQAAEGYPLDDPRRAPNTYSGVSNHTTGNAMDISIPWKNGGGLNDQDTNKIIVQFGLSRPVPKEPWHFELL